ncbi:MAG: sugar phosphate nucleotidyltransferase [Acidobacteriota bacterium]
MALKRMDQQLFVALLAGGRGTRFWPLSRSAEPKQFLDVTGEGPLLAVTRDRMDGLCPPEHVFVVTGADLARRCRQILDFPTSRVLGEPVGRNTCPAVGLALLHARHHGNDDAVLLALPTDHHVAKRDRLARVIAKGVKAARRLRGTVLFGAVPDRPETGYGYLSLGEERSLPGLAGLRRLARFKEKPDLAGAKRLLRQGAWWNTGMFCLHVGATLETIDRVLPELGQGLEELSRSYGKRTFKKALAEIYPKLPSISFDHGVLEHQDEIHALPAEVGWSDVASWEALAPLLPSDRKGNAARGDAVFHDATNCLAVAQGDRPLVLLGTQDLVLVDAGDVVFACPRDRARDIVGLRKALEKSHSVLL